MTDQTDQKTDNPIPEATGKSATSAPDAATSDTKGPVPEPQAAPEPPVPPKPEGRPLLSGSFWMLFWLTLGVGMAVTGAFLRPPLPMDETRYLAVAWEMWREQGFIVPFLNGETYSHKPPLLFWLMNAGWSLVGIDSPLGIPVAGLVAPIFGLIALACSGLIARRLWPGQWEVAALAPVLLIGGLFWALFSTLTMFDMLLAAFAGLGMLGILRSWIKGGLGGFMLLGLAIGLGVLAKGPAILLSVMPVCLLAPLWGPALTGGVRPMTWRAWYLFSFCAVILGAIIALAWAGPAAYLGGEEYRNAIFWGQSAGRMVDSFAHARPWWWYAALMPALLLPWTLWLPFWRALGRGIWAAREGAVRFCLLWFLPAFLAFSAISGKQLHYLLPVFPAFALVLARGFAAEPRALPGSEETGLRLWRFEQVPVALLLLVAGLAVFLLPLVVDTWVADQVRLPPWASWVDPRPGIAIFVAGFAFLLITPRSLRVRIAMLGVVSAGLVLGLHIALRDVVAKYYDLAPAAAIVAEAQAEGRPVAQFGKYHGQFHFAGRLTEPVGVVEIDWRIKEWAEANPNGLFVTYWDTGEADPAQLDPVYSQPFRSDWIVMWDAERLIEWPELGQRLRSLPTAPPPQPDTESDAEPAAEPSIGTNEPPGTEALPPDASESSLEETLTDQPETPAPLDSKP
ncbi:MAG: hypothetical protein ACPGOV_05425 [Magnetovibrionaceae bacterium]